MKVDTENLQIKVGPAVSSLVERLSSFGGYFVQSAYTMVSFIGRFVLRVSILYQKFHHRNILLAQSDIKKKKNYSLDDVRAGKSVQFGVPLSDMANWWSKYWVCIK